MSKIASMIPGLPQDLFAGGEEDTGRRMKRMVYITDSMSTAELDSDGACFMEWGKDGKPEALSWRVTRVAKGSGTTVREVEELLCQYRVMANMAKQAGGKKGWCVPIPVAPRTRLFCTGFNKRRSWALGVGEEPTVCHRPRKWHKYKYVCHCGSSSILNPLSLSSERCKAA